MKNLKQFETFKRTYDKNIKIGDYVKLEFMDGEYGFPQSKTIDPCPSKGDVGIVEDIDGAGHIHVHWLCGSGLSLIPDVDKYEIISKNEYEKIKKTKEFNL